MISVIIGLFSGIFIFLLAAFVSVPNHNAPGRSVPPFDPRCGKNAVGHLLVPSSPCGQQAGQFQVPVEQMVVLNSVQMAYPGITSFYPTYFSEPSPPPWV